MLSPDAECFGVPAVQRACSILSSIPHALGCSVSSRWLRVRVAPGAVRLPQVERRALGHEQDGAELQLPLHCKVLPGERVLHEPTPSPADVHASTTL